MTPAEMRALADELEDVGHRAVAQASDLRALADREERGRASAVVLFSPPRVEVCARGVEWCGRGSAPASAVRVHQGMAGVDFCSSDCRIGVGRRAAGGRA